MTPVKAAVLTAIHHGGTMNLRQIEEALGREKGDPELKEIITKLRDEGWIYRVTKGADRLTVWSAYDTDRLRRALRQAEEEGLLHDFDDRLRPLLRTPFQNVFLLFRTPSLQTGLKPDT